MLASSLDHSSPPRTAVSSTTGSPMIGRIPLGGGGGNVHTRYITPSPGATYEASRSGRDMNTNATSSRKEVHSSSSAYSLSLVSSAPLTIFPPETKRKSTDSLDDSVSAKKAMAEATTREASASQTHHQTNLSSLSSPQERAAIPSYNKPINYREGAGGSSSAPLTAVFTNIFPRAVPSSSIAIVASSAGRTSTPLTNAAAATHSREGGREKEEENDTYTNEGQGRPLPRQQDLIDSALRQFKNDSKKVCGGRSASPAAPSAALRTRSPTVAGGDKERNREGHHYYYYAAPTASHLIRTNIAQTSYHGPIGRDGSPAPTALAVVRTGGKSPARGGAQQHSSTSPRRVASSSSFPLLSRNGSTERLGVGVERGATTTSPSMGSARDIRERQYAAVRARSPGGLRRLSPSSLSAPSASTSLVQTSVLWNPSGKAVDKPNTTIRAVNAALLRATSTSSASPTNTNVSGITGGVGGSRRTSPLSSPARRAPVATTTVSYSLVRTNTTEQTERRRSPTVRSARGTDSPNPMSYLLHPSFSLVAGGNSANAAAAAAANTNFLGVSGQSFPSASAEGRLISLIKNFNQTCLVKWHRQVKEIAGKANRCAYLTSTDATFLENILARNIAFMRNLEGIITDVATSGGTTTRTTTTITDSWETTEKRHQQMQTNRTSPKGRVPSPTGKMSRTSSPSPAATIRRGTANTVPTSPATSSASFHYKASSASFSQQSSVPDSNSFAAQTTATTGVAGRSGGGRGGTENNKGSFSSSSIHPGVLRFAYEAFNRSTRLNNAINLLLVGNSSQVRVHLSQAQDHRNAMMSDFDIGERDGDYNSSSSKEGVKDAPTPQQNRRRSTAAPQEQFTHYDSFASSSVHHGALAHDPQSPYSSQIVVPANVIADGMRASNKDQRRTTHMDNEENGDSASRGFGFEGRPLLMSLDNDGLTGAYIPTTESEEKGQHAQEGEAQDGEATPKREGNTFRFGDAEVVDSGGGSKPSSPQQITPTKVQEGGSSPLKASSSSASQAFRDFVGKSFIRDAAESVLSTERKEASEGFNVGEEDTTVANAKTDHNADNNGASNQQRGVPPVSPRAAASGGGVARGGGGGGVGADGVTPPRGSANTTTRRASVGGGGCVVSSNNASFASTSAVSISFSAASFARNVSNNVNSSSFAADTTKNLLTFRSSSVEVGRGAARETVGPQTALWMSEGPAVFAMGAGTGGGRVVTKAEGEAYATAVIMGRGGEGASGSGGSSGDAPAIFGREVVVEGGRGLSPSLMLEPSAHRLHDDSRHKQHRRESGGIEAGGSQLLSPSHSPLSSVNLAKTAAFVSLTSAENSGGDIRLGVGSAASPLANTPRLFGSCSSLPVAAHDADTVEEATMAKSNTMPPPTKINATATGSTSTTMHTSVAGSVAPVTAVVSSGGGGGGDASPTSPSRGQATASTSSPPSPTPVECKQEVDDSNSNNTLSAYPSRAATVVGMNDGVRRGNPQSTIPIASLAPPSPTSPENTIKTTGEVNRGSPFAFSSSSSTTTELVHAVRVDEVVQPISHAAIVKQAQSDHSLEALLSKRRATNPHQHQQHAARRRTAVPSLEPFTAAGGAEKVVVFIGSTAVGAAMPPLVLRKDDVREERNQNAAATTTTKQREEDWQEGAYVALSCAAVSGAAVSEADGGDMGGIGRLARAGEGQRQQALLDPFSFMHVLSTSDKRGGSSTRDVNTTVRHQHLNHPQQRPRAQSPTFSKSSEAGSTVSNINSTVGAVVRKKSLSLPHYLQPLLSGGRSDSPLRQNGAAFRQSSPTRSTKATDSPMRQPATPTRGGAGVGVGRSLSPNTYVCNSPQNTRTHIQTQHSHMQRANPESFLSGYNVGAGQHGEEEKHTSVSSNGSHQPHWQQQQQFESSSFRRASDRYVVMSQRQRTGLASLSVPILDDSGGSAAAADGSTSHSTHRSMSAAGDIVEMMSPIPTRPSNSPQRLKGAAVTNNTGVNNVIFSVAAAAAEKRARDRRIYLLELIEVLGMKLRGELRQGGDATWGSESDPRDRTRSANPTPREATAAAVLSSSELETAHKAFLEVYGGSEGTKHFYRWIASKGGRLE